MLDVTSREQVLEVLRQSGASRTIIEFVERCDGELDLIPAVTSARRDGSLAADPMMRLFNLAAWHGDAQTLRAAADAEDWEVEDFETEFAVTTSNGVRFSVDPLASLRREAPFTVHGSGGDTKQRGIQDLLAALEAEGADVAITTEINADVHADNYGG